MRTESLFSFLTLICLFGNSFNSFASNPAKPAASVQATELMHQNKALFFEENKGQLMNENHKAITDVKYYGHSNGVYIYCKQGMLSFVFTKVEKGEEQVSEATGLPIDAQTFASKFTQEGRSSPSALRSSISTSRMDLVLMGSNPTATITATDQQEYYENFYTTGDADHGITNVHTYKTVTYKNIYPNIDMILKTAGQGMEYSFLVHPGGNAGDIKLRWDGVENIKKLKDLKIEYSCSLGNMEESAPKSFVEGKEVESSFIKKGEVYSFGISGYDKAKDLLIDPSLNWGTYFGGSGGENATGVSTDALGNVFVSGSTTSTSDIATSGAYQTSYAGGNSDIFLAKFSSVDSLSWATYYGGSGDDEAAGVSTDGSSNVYITGYTSSTSGITTSGAYQTSNGGNYDAFLAKFSSTGVLSWATYYGGGGYDESSGVSVDGSSNVYMTGSTQSSSSIVTTGAYQTSYAGGLHGGDAFLAKFSSSGAISWATYYGGSGDDGASGVSIDGSGNVYITGSTTSTGGIATSGAYQASNQGGPSGGYGYDAFLAKFSSVGSLSWATYYGGSELDYAYGVKTDDSGNAYITGWTYSHAGIATSGAYQTSYEGGIDISNVFLARFSSSGSLNWATYYGYRDVASGISIDGSGNVYVTGWSNSCCNGIITAGAYQTSFGGGNYDAFLAKFSSGGTPTWGTYYGGLGFEKGYGVSADVFGNVYITGSVYGGNNGIATHGAFQTSPGGGYYDAFLAKFSFPPLKNDAGLNSIENSSGAICPGSQTVKAILENYGTSTLTSDSIYWKVNGTTQTPIKWSGSLKTDSTTVVTLGTYNFSSGSNAIVAWSARPNGLKDSVSGNDTAKINFKASLPSAAVISDTSICYGSAISIGAAAVAGSSYSWLSSPSGFGSTSSNPSVSPTSTASYTLTETNANGCVNSNSVTITVNALPDAFWIEDNILKNYHFYAKDSSLSKSSYTWDFGDSSVGTTTGYDVSHVFPQNKKYTVKLKVTNTFGCTNEDDSTINVTISGINPSVNMDIYGLNIYPNPFTDKTLINFTLPKSSHVKISVMDMKGNVLFTPADKSMSAGPNDVEINAMEAGLAAGTYFVNIAINGEFVSKKIIVIKN